MIKFHYVLTYGVLVSFFTADSYADPAILETCNKQLAQSLVSYWNFDYGAGLTVQDPVSGNTGEWEANQTQWVPGKVNTGGFFNGANGVSAGVSTYLANSSFSFAAWINPCLVCSTNRAIIDGYGTGGPEFRINSSNYLDLLAQNIQLLGTSSFAVPSGVWSHVAVTYNLNGAFAFYINGKAAGSATNAYSFNNLPLSIGKGSASGGEYFAGYIDEVGVWNTILEPSQISGLYNTGGANAYISSCKGFQF